MATITHLYDNYAEAERAVAALEAAGVPNNDISIVGRNGTTTGSTVGTSTETTAPVTDEAHTGAGTGASLGTLVGGGAGLLAGIGALAIPGVGPVVAAGWLIATLTGAGAGAAAGGLLGSLTGAGVPEHDAHVYAEGVRRGGTLVSVQATETNAAEVEEILSRSDRVDITGRREVYQQGGWTAHDPAAGPYEAPTVADRNRPF
jgi:hypothetical protein